MVIPIAQESISMVYPQAMSLDNEEIKTIVEKQKLILPKKKDLTC